MNGIYRVEKRKMADVRGLQIHHNREKDGVSHSNQDIDWSRTDRNVHLQECENFTNAIKNEIEQLNLKKAIRKDATVMLDHLVTASPEFFESRSEIEIQEFFLEAYNAIGERFGHIISAEIHMDERTPHLHVCTVPITEDGRLSAKDLLGNKKAISVLQDEMYEKLFCKWELERGVKYTEHLENGSDIPKHKVTAKFKEETQSELVRLQGELEKSETNLKRSSTRLENLKKSVQEENGRLKEIKTEFEGMRAVKGILESMESVEVQEKGLLGKVVVDKAEYEKVVQTAKLIDELEEYSLQFGQYSQKLEAETQKAQKEIEKMRDIEMKKVMQQQEQCRRIMETMQERTNELQEQAKDYEKKINNLNIRESAIMDKIIAVDTFKALEKGRKASSSWKGLVTDTVQVQYDEFCDKLFSTFNSVREMAKNPHLQKEFKCDQMDKLGEVIGQIGAGLDSNVEVKEQEWQKQRKDFLQKRHDRGIER